jgi:hypothetical protein
LDVVVAAVARNGAKFSQYGMLWGCFPWTRVQNVESLILVGALFTLDGGRIRERKKKEKMKNNCHGEVGFPQGWTPLAGCAAGCSC